jgi:uncharacterized protein (TIGR03435 family)
MKTAIVGFLASCLVYAQAPDPSVVFEVASVKVSPPVVVAGDGRRMATRIGCMGGPGTQSPGQYTCSNSTVNVLIREAYNLKNYQIPNFSVSEGSRYDINAKIPAGSSKEQVRTMLQNLLAERFKLTYHFDKKEMQVYELVVGKNGVKMKPSPPEDPPPAAGASGPATPPADGVRFNPQMGPDGFPILPARRNSSSISMMGNGGTRISTNDATMQSIAMFLSNQLGRPVTDNTGLSGKFDYVLTFSREGMEGMGGPSMIVTAGPGGGPPPPPPPPSDAPTIFAAVQEQLGLKLEQKKGLVDLFVIDHIEKNPVEN